MSRCLVTGGSGLLGRELTAWLGRRHEVVGAGCSSPGEDLRRADLRQPSEVRRLLAEVRPDVVVHGAAYRDPDFCEDHPEETRRLNVAPLETMFASLPRGTRFIFISSDYVFDGEAPPYVEGDATCPVNEYGRSKVEGEQVVLNQPGGVVLRIPLLVGAGASLDGSGFIAQMRAAVLDGVPRELDDAGVRFPTWTRDVARAVEFLLNRDETGLFHYSTPRGATRYAWTLEMARVLGVAAGHIRAAAGPLSQRAVRPPNSQLEPARLRALGYEHFTEFPDVVRDVLAVFGASP